MRIGLVGQPDSVIRRFESFIGDIVGGCGICRVHSHSITMARQGQRRQPYIDEIVLGTFHSRLLQKLFP